MPFPGSRTTLTGREPKYVQVKETIKNQIRTGSMPANTQIPTEAELCVLFDVSRITIRKALDELEQEGYLKKLQGRGTFVSNERITQRLSKFYSFSEELKKHGVQEFATVIKMTTINGDQQIADSLQVDLNEQLWKIQRIRRTRDLPYAIEVSYIPKFLAGGLTKELINKNGLYNSLNIFGVNVDSAKEHLIIVNLRKDQAKMLEVRDDAAAVRLIRVAYDRTTPVEYCTSLVRGDFFDYSIELK